VRTLRQTSFREQAREVIRASIVGGELVPGEVYSATTLSIRLGVSQTPIREALLDLANDGLVEPVRNRGFRILTVADADLDEISELRIMIEVPAMRRVVEKASNADLDALEGPLTALEWAAERNELAGFLRADREFHLELLGLAGNRRLVRLAGQLRDQTRLTGLKAIADSGHLFSSAEEHRLILDALRARDVHRAESLARGHLEHTRGKWAGRSEQAHEEG
jgi:DNA-binding GntR family transcriptional regulator